MGLMLLAQWKKLAWEWSTLSTPLFVEQSDQWVQSSYFWSESSSEPSCPLPTCQEPQGAMYSPPPVLQEGVSSTLRGAGPVTPASSVSCVCMWPPSLVLFWALFPFHPDCPCPVMSLQSAWGKERTNTYSCLLHIKEKA
jgi:hypothetical protein